MARGLFVGLTTVDIFNIVDNHPLPNQKIKARRQMVSAGGPAANAAVAFGAFDNNADLFTGIGSHQTGALALDDLHRHKVRVIDCSASPEELPVLSTIIIDSSSGNRCVVYSDAQNRTLFPDQRYDQLVNDYEIILFDGYYLEHAVALARAAPGSAITVLDGGSWKEGLEKLLPFIDYAVCSADFNAPGCSSVNHLLDYMEEIGVKGAAISNGAEPIIYRGNDEQAQIPVPQVQPLDTLGAGDILHGTFCHHILTNSFPRSLELAACNASRSCLSYGTREWIGNSLNSGNSHEIREK